MAIIGSQKTSGKWSKAKEKSGNFEVDIETLKLSLLARLQFKRFPSAPGAYYYVFYLSDLIEYVVYGTVIQEVKTSNIAREVGIHRIHNYFLEH